MSRLSIAVSLLGSLSIIGIGFAPGCGGSNSNSGFGSSGSSGGSSNGSSGTGSNGSSGASSSSGGCGITGCGDGAGSSSGGDAGCQNLQCQVHACSGGGHTTLSGTVMDPAGRNPLYNVVVYVPNSPGGMLATIPIGIGANSCSCGALFSGSPITYAITDTAGKFTLTDVPDGANIPLVVQIGKWRKEITIPSITECSANMVPSGNVTLPKNLSDGKFASIPNIAVSTGGADTLECLLTRVGVDEAFFTGDPNGPGVHVFQGSGGNAAANGALQSPASLWDSQADLSRYDIVMLSCEGSPTTGVSAATAAVLAPYVNAGGRVFAEHYHYAFFTGAAASTYPQFANVANWGPVYFAGNDSPYNSDITGIIQTTLPNGKPFPEGVALKAWLGNVGALNGAGEIVVPNANARDNATVGASNVATPWVQLDPSFTPPSTQYFSWDMPFNPPVTDAGVPEYCGRVVYSDMHVSGSAADYQGGSSTVPTGCDATSALSPDEKAIEFILFDLSSCIIPVGYTPQDGGPPIFQ